MKAWPQARPNRWNWPKEGMAVTVQRTITENGVTRTDEMISKYQPWQAMYLVGPGVVIPGE